MMGLGLTPGVACSDSPRATSTRSKKAIKAAGHRKVKTLTVTTSPSAFDEEEYRLWRRYQTRVHGDNPNENNELGYGRFLVDTPLRRVRGNEQRGARPGGGGGGRLGGRVGQTDRHVRRHVRRHVPLLPSRERRGGWRRPRAASAPSTSSTGSTVSSSPSESSTSCPTACRPNTSSGTRLRRPVPR